MSNFGLEHDFKASTSVVSNHYGTSDKGNSGWTIVGGAALYSIWSDESDLTYSGGDGSFTEPKTAYVFPSIGVPIGAKGKLNYIKFIYRVFAPNRKCWIVYNVWSCWE